METDLWDLVRWEPSGSRILDLRTFELLEKLKKVRRAVNAPSRSRVLDAAVLAKAKANINRTTKKAEERISVAVRQ